jgi:hypothetical protein
VRIAAWGAVWGMSWLGGSDAQAFVESCPYGVNAHQASNDALDAVAAAGIGWVRFDMNWLQMEPAQGTYDWTESDRFVEHATSLGLHVFVTVAYTPDWAVGAACNDADPNPENWCHNAPPADPSTWTSFVTAAVQRYGADVKAWGMWNEPNLLEFYRGTRPQWVSEILVPGSDAVHAACADCKVVGPELANLRNAHWDADEGVCVAGQCAFNGWNYSLKQILSQAAGSLDVVSHHKYTDPATALWQQALDGQVQVVKVTDGIKELTDMYAPGKPVWITELGWQSEPFGPHTNAYAASQLTAVYQGFHDVRAGTFSGAQNQPWPELEKLFWYDLHDDPNGYSWGLLTSALAPKEPYDAYAAFVSTHVDCTVEPGTGGAGGAGGSATGGSGGTAGGSGGGAAGAGNGAGSGAGAGGGGADGSGATGSGDAAADPDADGCSCRQVPGRPRGTGPEGVGWALAAAVAAGATRRRRL